MLARAGSLLLIAAVSFVLFACDPGDVVEPTPTPAEATNGVSDAQYLAIICTGLDRFSSSLVQADTEDEIVTVIRDYIGSLEEVSPPVDAEEFHQEFIEYLRESMDEPGELATRPRPVPEDDVRDRMAHAERNVDECQDLAFFDEEGSGP